MAHRTAGSGRGRSVPRVSEVLANSEFRALWAAEALSIAGDQLAKVALALLVYDRTQSALWSALVYAMTFFPALLGGLGLAQLADRFPRRSLLTLCSLTQAALIGLMTLPGTPLWALCALVFLVATVAAPANAAQNATTRESFTDDALYLRSQDLRGITMNTMMLLGLAGGGLLVNAIGTRPALGVDAATFLLAAALQWRWVHARAVAGSRDDGWFDGVRLLFADPKLRLLLLLSWLVGLAVVPEGLAAPLAAELGAPDQAVGWLLAADPLGFVAGAFLLSHYVSADARRRSVGVLAVLSVSVPVAFALRPGLGLALLLLALSGAAGAYVITVSATLTASVPNEIRGAASGVYRTGLRVAQGIGVAAGGVVAQTIGSATTTIALAGTAGVLAAVPIALMWTRVGAGERTTLPQRENDARVNYSPHSRKKS